MIATRSVHASLTGICQDAALECRLAHPFRDIRFARKRLPRLFVFYELDRGQQTQAADVADMAMTLEWVQRVHQLAAGARHAAKQLFLFQNVQYRVAGGHSHWMCLVSESVLECAGAVSEGVHHA